MPEATEKITVNLSVVDLGKIDLLVEQGFFANRTDFVKDSIRRALDTHEVAVREKVVRASGVMGIVSYSRSDLEAMRAKGRRMDLTAVGMAVFQADIPAELVDETFRSFRIYGTLRASNEVKEVLARKAPQKVS